MEGPLGKPNKIAPIFRHPFGDAVGRGQDSVVMPLKGRHGFVVKINHSKRKERTSPETIQMREQELLYKKKKYELLRFFMGGFIPESFFVLGEQEDGDLKRVKGYTVQERVPDVTFSELSEKQLSDTRLLQNLHMLLSRLIFMHKVINEVNASVPLNARLDVRLDLGPISRLVNKVESVDDIKVDKMDVDTLSSPNLLVDPSTMDVYCVDFGRGEWSDEKEATMLLAMSIAERRKRK